MCSSDLGHGRRAHPARAPSPQPTRSLPENRVKVIQQLRDPHRVLSPRPGQPVRRRPLPEHTATGCTQGVLRRLRQNTSYQPRQQVTAPAPRQHRTFAARLEGASAMNDPRGRPLRHQHPVRRHATGAADAFQFAGMWGQDEGLPRCRHHLGQERIRIQHEWDGGRANDRAD